MSTKFWVCITIISLAIAHIYIHTDFIKQTSKDFKREVNSQFSRHVNIIWVGAIDVWEQCKNHLKFHLQEGRRITTEARRNIADIRRYRQKSKQRKAFKMR